MIIKKYIKLLVQKKCKKSAKYVQFPQPILKGKQFIAGIVFLVRYSTK
jgi:hypothetical protein